MSRFDMPEHNFLPHNKLRGEQLNKVHSDKQEGNKAELEQKQEGRTEIVCDTFQQAVDASAQQVIANINRAVMRAKGNFNIVDKKAAVVHSKSDLSNLGSNVDIKPATTTDINPTAQEATVSDVIGPNVPNGGTTPTDNPTETTISNEELYANREKYAQEFVDSLNIGLSAETFSGVIDTYFQKVTINGEEVYILRSGTLTQVKDLISQIYVADKLATTPDYSPKTITLDDILQHFGVTESDLQTLMQKLGATDLADFVTKLKNADINELTYQSSNEPISIESLMQDFGASRTEIEYLMSQFGATDIDDFISKLKALPMDVIEDMVSSHPEKYPKAGVEEIMSLVTYLRARSDVFFESNVQDIKNLLSYMKAPYAFDPLEANGGYALTDQQTFENRKANYYYMCYLNGIPCTGHEFEDGTYNKEIARQCGLYGYENVFEDYLNNENVQQYLLENFGITVSTPLSEEYKELWDKLANLAAIGENGKNTGEYNVYNVLKYFGLALTDSQFMSYIDKVTYVQDENSITNNTWDIEAVKSVISERYPELLENSEVLTDEFLEWIGSNAFEFLLYNQSKLRANGLQDFVNYGNIPSWITYYNGTEFNKELLLKCCIQSMAKLADIGNKLGYDPKEFVNRNIADYVTDVYQTLMENHEETQATGGPRRVASNPQIPDYVMNQLWAHFGPTDFTFEYDSSGDINFYNKNGDQLGSIDLNMCWVWYQNDTSSLFHNYDGFTFKNGEIVNNGYFDAKRFFELYYSESKLPAEQRQFFTNGLDDLYQYIKDNTNFEDLCSIIGFLMSPTLVGYGETQDINDDKLNLYNDLYSEIFEGENNDIYQYLYNTLSNNLQANGFTDLLRMMPTSSDNATDISALFYWAGNRIGSIGFDWNADGILLNADAGQGNTGDCWYVATNIAMAQHPELLQLIKDHCIEIDDVNRTYTVTLGGEKYTYTFDEIMNANELSSGDVELRVFEMAAREHLGSGADNSIATGGWLDWAVELFAGDGFDFGVNEYYYYDIDESNISEILEHIKSGTYVSMLGVMDDGYWAIDIETGEKVELAGHHAYAVVGGNDNYIYIVNPWDNSKTLRLNTATIKNNPEGFAYQDISVDDFSRAIQNANNIVPYGIQTNLENGAYFDSNGNFDWNQYYEDCKGYGMNPSNLQFMFDKTADGSKLSIFNPDGTCTIVFKTTSGQIQIIEIGKLTPSFIAPDGVPFDIDNFTDEELIEELHKSMDDISLFIMSDGKIDRDLLSSMLPKFTVGGWFDSSALMILMQYYKKDDGSVDAEGFKQLLSNFSNYDDVERFAQSVLIYEQVQAAMMSNNAQAAIYALQSWAEDRLAKLKNSGSIYNEMDYWQWSDVLTNPLASTEDYIAAINAMNSILNAAKSIGVSLDAYIHMNPAERERRRGMLTTPMNDEILTEPWNIIPVDESDDSEGAGMYYSTPNQSSCYSAPEWFVEAYLNGEISDDDEITWNVFNETCTEAEEKVYLERQHYRFWQMTNSSLLIGLPATEQYSLYMMDMMYFSMWLNTDAIIQGYDQDTAWEDLYEAYSNSNFKLF